MAKTEKKVQAVTIDYGCDKCGSGFMRYTGLSLSSHPPQFVHRCNKCGYEETYRESYPHIEYRTVDSPEPQRESSGSDTTREQT